MTIVVVDVAAEFTVTPGGRYRAEGVWSGEEFREKHVEPKLEEDKATVVVIDLDGPKGFTSSFLEEVFGGLVRKFGPSIVKRVQARADAIPARAAKARAFMDRAIVEYRLGPRP